MKNLIAKLKGMNYKQFALQHGEKVALGIGSFFTLLVLWGGISHALGRYTKTPEEFSAAAKKANDLVIASPFADDEKKKTAVIKFQEFTQAKILASVRVEEFEYKKPMSPKLYPRDEPIGEPNFLAMEDMVASYGTFVMSLAKPPAAPAAAAEKPAGDEPTEDEDAPRPKAKPAPKKPASKKGETQETVEEPSNARGVKFVVVRGVFPFRQQILNLQKAMNLETVSQASEFFEIVDFSIQRQKAGRNSDPWAGQQWKDVNLETALDFLSEAEDFDQEIVREEYTSPVITSPLPSRVTGAWSPDLVSHPQLESFLLSEEEQAKKLEENRKLMEQAQEKGAEPTAVKKGGFGSKVVDKNKLLQDVQKADKANSNAPKLPGARQGMEGGPLAVVSGAAKFLLFRFFDTTIEPGECYRYRVQLVLRNPNFGAPLESVKDSSVNQGETRVTSWSEPSPAVAVQSDLDYFLVRGRRPKLTLKSGAEFDVFQWDPNVGTLIEAKLSNVWGQVIGGRTKTERLNVAKPSLEVENVEFYSKELLVDSAGPPAINVGTFETDNPELGISRSDWTRLVEEKGYLDIAVTIDPSGELRQIDRSKASNDEKRRVNKRLTEERKAFANLNQSEDTGSSRNRLDTSKYEKGGGANKATKAKGRERNPLRIGAPGGAGKAAGRP